MLLGTLTRDDDISRDFNAEKNKQSQRRVEGWRGSPPPQVKFSKTKKFLFKTSL